MNQLTIRTLSLSLLAVFLFNTCVYGVALSGVLHFHKVREKNALHKPTKQIIEIHISADLVEKRNELFHWEKEWEFEYRGEMYDVVDSRKEGSTWIFSCKHDTKEEILKNRASREAKRNQENRETQCKKNLKVGSEYFSESISLKLSLTTSDVVSNDLTERNYLSHRSISDPPPDYSVI